MDDEKAVTKEIAMRIKTILKNNGMTVSGLAYQAGMSPSTIYSLYSDKCQNIGVNTLYLSYPRRLEIELDRR
jgi:DNA-binding Xre family transcriptional regulator